MGEASFHLTETSRRMTLAEWADLPEDEPGELVDGHLEEEELPNYAHEAAVAWLLVYLGVWVLAHKGSVTGSDTKYAVNTKRGRKPDLSVYLPGSAFPRGDASLIDVPPSIAVEVISPRPRDAKRDRIDKLHEYASFGVRWYWILDPSLRTIEIYELNADKRYVHTLAAGEGKIAVPGCPGLDLDLDALWAHVDQFVTARSDAEE
jgi:Uma2 family endonuclease